MNRIAATILVATALTLCGTADNAAAEDTPKLETFKKCVTLKDDVSRLACFDKAAAGFDFEKASASLKEAKKLKEEARTLKEEKRKLAEAEQRRKEEVEAMRTEEFGKADAEVRTVDRVDTTIKRVIEPRVGGKYLVLNNGMVWQITDGGRTGPIKEGMAVHINKTTFGGYLLTIELARRTFRVKRVN
ncbi:hypothetical protein ACFO5Q_00015 [Kordiimonas lipolytica]|uniref:Type IV pilus biogenesis protein PilP n=1 Tax=Kordiimonas lipolytica TaxID=1662421 RepID=A0ABV8U5N9_9PROT|nr:hypothetical protein [Kordiimonas lipolytica]